ncbi:hypothetical protein ACTNEO_08535 [Gracilibacillus sp. HCP3S3_G5_1]
MKAKQITSKAGKHFKTSNKPIVITSKVKKTALKKSKGGCCMK